MENDPFAPFELWIKFAHKRPLAPVSVGSYRGMWSSWVKFLSAEGLKWDKADPVDALRFLVGLKARAYSDPCSSTVSKVRYATVLRKIYEHAVAAGLVTENPVPLEDPSLPKSEAADSAFFQHLEYTALVENLPVALTWLDARNRALLACLLLDGLTGAEVAALKVDDVKLDGEKDARGRTRLMRLHIHGTEGRPAQGRTVQLAWKTARALSDWLDLRGASSTLATPLFPKAGEGGRLTHAAIFRICVNHALISLSTLGKPDVRWTHAGPNSMRNSCLLRWLEGGWPSDLVAKRAGISHGKHLSRLLQSSMYR